MKFMTNGARGIFVVGCCLFIAGTTLNAAKPDSRELESNQVVDITESLPSVTGEKVAAAATAPATAVKKKAMQTAKGVVYLPIVSLSSYVPIVAQILMMVLMIALSGLFGAWLMFRELAKRVQVFQEAMPAAANAPHVADGVVMQVELPRQEAAQQSVIQAPVKKCTLFVSQKAVIENLPKKFLINEWFPVER